MAARQATGRSRKSQGDTVMADESTRTVKAVFATREEADRAVERLVQEHRIDRSDVFVQADEDANTAGTQPSGGDIAADPAEGSGFSPALTGEIEVSADVTDDDAMRVRETLLALGAGGVSCN